MIVTFKLVIEVEDFYEHNPAILKEDLKNTVENELGVEVKSLEVESTK